MRSREEVHIKNVHVQFFGMVISAVVRVAVGVLVDIAHVDESIIGMNRGVTAKQGDIKWLLLRDLSQQDDEEAKC